MPSTAQPNNYDLHICLNLPKSQSVRQGPQANNQTTPDAIVANDILNVRLFFYIQGPAGILQNVVPNPGSVFYFAAMAAVPNGIVLFGSETFNQFDDSTTYGQALTGFQGTVDCRQTALITYIGANASAVVGLQIQVADAAAGAATQRATVFSGQINVFYDFAPDDTTAAPPPGSAPLSTLNAFDFVRSGPKLGVLTLTGVTASLKALVSATMSVGATYFVNDATYGGGEWSLTTGMAAENIPGGILLPVDYNAISNARYWLRGTASAKMLSNHVSGARPSITAAASVTLTPGNSVLAYTASYNIGAGSGAYEYDVILSPTGAQQGNKAFVNLNIAASTNPTVKVWNNSATGTPLDIVGGSSAAASVWHAEYTFNGTAWEKDFSLFMS